MDADICETCEHYAASRVPGTLGLCALLDQPVRFENSCEKWMSALLVFRNEEGEVNA